ncbi:MAG: CoA transferase, partial [Pseudonocardia sp.]|nr:CoA transferase [Pseudonocardia sp.]
VSTSAQSVAERVMRLVGRPDLVDEPWFATGGGRAEHADELDAAVSGWIGKRERDEVMAEFERANAAVAPIYTAADVMADPQFEALGSILRIEDEELGPIRMQNVPFRLSETPGRVRSTGPSLGRHTAEVLAGYGVSARRLERLREDGVV